MYYTAPIFKNIYTVSKCLKKLYLLQFTLYRAWSGGIGNWPFTWWTDQLLSFNAWHCWLGYQTRKILSCNVFGKILNTTQSIIFSQTWLRYVWLMAWQIRLSVCRLWRACTKNHEDRSRGSPPPQGLNRKGVVKQANLAYGSQYLVTYLLQLELFIQLANK